MNMKKQSFRLAKRITRMSGMSKGVLVFIQPGQYRNFYETNAAGRLAAARDFLLEKPGTKLYLFPYDKRDPIWIAG